MSSRKRIFQVSERIRVIIANQLLRAADPRFHLVTITSVMVSADLRSAKVYWIATGGLERVPEVEEAFGHSAGMFRRAVGDELSLRFVPELKFFYDDTFDTVEKVEKIFAKINAKGQ